MGESTCKPTGFAFVHDAKLNKSTAFSPAERERHGLRGLLPARVCSQEMQIARALENIRRKEHDIERYIFLSALQGRNERLFFETVRRHIDELLPLVYTPTVGQACQEFAHIFRQPRGFYVTAEDRGEIRRILDNWPERDVRIIVVTDGERILGLGDLGANGMGIPLGKLALYTACAGIDPKHCMPVMLDVGTNNEELRADPLYLGVTQPRITGEPYTELMDEFVAAVNDAFPRCLIQFEDFLTPNAYRLLERYRDRTLCFNDDIQGTAAVALAGVYSAIRITGHAFTDLRIMFLGAGSAATGIADLMTSALIEEGLTGEEARRRLWFIDGKGLVVRQRDDLPPHKRPYAQDHPPATFIQALRSIRPQVLIGATGHPGTFTEEVVRTMAGQNDRPVIFALSNPTSRAECTAEQAYRWSNERVVFASGSPFPAVTLSNGDTAHPAQGNNVYVFPGVGLGALACEATKITDGMFLAAARALAGQVQQDGLDRGAVYPPLGSIRDVSLGIAMAVCEVAYAQGLARLPRPPSLAEHLDAQLYESAY